MAKSNINMEGKHTLPTTVGDDKHLLSKVFECIISNGKGMKSWEQ